jgi:hypothetical protein
MTTREDLPVRWADLKRALRVDGWLRDIYVEGTDVSEWQRAYDYVRHPVADGVAEAASHPDRLPDDIAAVFALQNTLGARLDLGIGNVGINCHFFTESATEFDINPAGVASPADARTLLTFMEGLASAVGRNVMLTGDSQPHQLWLTFDPSAKRWSKGPMFNRRDDQLDPVLT